jgi:hypothetical protein
MTRTQKIAKKKLRAFNRAEKRNKKYREFLNSNRHSIEVGGFGAAKNGSWYDPNSPTGYSQVCSYFGTCQSPCNGDC